MGGSPIKMTGMLDDSFRGLNSSIGIPLRVLECKLGPPLELKQYLLEQ